MKTLYLSAYIYMHGGSVVGAPWGEQFGVFGGALFENVFEWDKSSKLLKSSRACGMADTHVFGMSAPATTLSGGSWSANPLTVPETMYSSQPGAGGHKLQSQYTVVKPEPGIAVAASAPVFAAQPAATDAKTKKLSALRRGKWTQEEESYANRLIQEFKNGLLPLTDGTTLRTFLSKLLNCDPMRISKKFVGSNCIGKQVCAPLLSQQLPAVRVYTVFQSGLVIVSPKTSVCLSSVLFSRCCSKADYLFIDTVASLVFIYC
jgi:hypothetical protein